MQVCPLLLSEIEPGLGSGADEEDEEEEPGYGAGGEWAGHFGDEERRREELCEIELVLFKPGKVVCWPVSFRD